MYRREKSQEYSASVYNECTVYPLRTLLASNKATQTTNERDAHYDWLTELETDGLNYWILFYVFF